MHSAVSKGGISFDLREGFLQAFVAYHSIFCIHFTESVMQIDVIFTVAFCFLADGIVHVYAASIPWVFRTETPEVVMSC